MQQRGLSVLSAASTHDPFGLWGPPVPKPVGTLANARVAQRAAAERAAAEHRQTLLPKVLASDDAAEGLTSFVERREARFTGR